MPDDLLNKCDFIESTAGRLSIRTLDVILSAPGALFEDRPLTTLPTRDSVTKP